LAYPLSTWVYAWHEQRQLRQELADQNPGLAATAEAALDNDDLLSATPPSTSPESGPDSPASLDPAETERQAQLAAFETAAEAFAGEVRQKTGTPLGRMVIPSIGLDVVMVEGTGYGDPRAGPGHWPDTLFPGQGGSVVVSGHRTTYGAPFRRLDELQRGDEIDLILPYGIAKYVVARTIILYPDGMQSVANADHEQVALVGRYSIYSAKERIVVQGDLEAFKLLPPAASTPAG